MVEANNEKVDQGLTWMWAFNAHPCKDSNNWGFLAFLKHIFSKTASNISIQCDTQFPSTVNGNSSSEELSRDINHPKRRTVFNYLKFWIVALQISIVRDLFSFSCRSPTYTMWPRTSALFISAHVRVKKRERNVAVTLIKFAVPKESTC